MVKLEKYIYENDTIYELNEKEFYEPVIVLRLHEDSICNLYAKIRLKYLLENNLEFLVELVNSDNFDEYFINYGEEMAEKEKFIYGKMKLKDVMSKLLAREIVIYQELD